MVRHHFGGVEIRYGRRELGHIHGNHLVDLPFPVRVREELVRGGRAQVHHILPESGWVSFPIRREDDIPGAIALLRLAYERAVAKAGNAAPSPSLKCSRHAVPDPRQQLRQ